MYVIDFGFSPRFQALFTPHRTRRLHVFVITATADQYFVTNCAKKVGVHKSATTGCNYCEVILMH